MLKLQLFSGNLIMAAYDSKKNKANKNLLKKSPTGIKGLDEVTEGGLPTGRPTLICGGPGSGKTLLAIQFLSNGATLYKEPGLFISFEESADDLVSNVMSLDIDIKMLEKKKLLIIDHILIAREEFEDASNYDLEGLFIRIADAIKRFKIKRVVLDTIEVLFSKIANESLLRSELQRLFNWLKEEKVTAIVTGEQGKESLTRYGIEEYVADCVIFLDNRTIEQISTRRLRIIKYRGSSHGSNEYPFLIDKEGISVVPITSMQLNYIVPKKFIKTGIKRLDYMLGGKGYYAASSVLISGAAGAGKSSFAAKFADSICHQGKKCLYFAFEESENQIIRNMRSIGLDLQKWVNKNKLQLSCMRPTHCGLEMHLKTMIDAIDKFKPQAVIVDPLTNLKGVASGVNVKSMLTRLIDYIKLHQITGLFTSLMLNNEDTQTQEGVSSLMDTWIILNYIDNKGERNRVIKIYKSRGMPHSKQAREILITKNGIDLADVYTGTGEVLTGAARVIQLIKEEIAVVNQENDLKHKKQDLIHKNKLLLNKINEIKTDLDNVNAELDNMKSQEEKVKKVLRKGRKQIAQIKMADL